MKEITGHLTQKNGKWYAVINLYNAEGKRKEKWCGLNIEASKKTEREATYQLLRLLDMYNKGELQIQEKQSSGRRATGEQFVECYIAEWLEKYKYNLSVLTYNTYRGMLTARVIPYFKPLQIPLNKLTGEDMNDFYHALREDGLSGATAQRYHSMMHLAFNKAKKQKLIVTNPCAEADRPKAPQYIGNFYNAEEVKRLIECLEGDMMKTAVILAAYYGLRRSEVIGLKWSAIDWDNNKICIRHKIIENKLGKKKIEGYDIMKTKSSYRTLPLIPFVREVLLEEKARQEEMQRLFKKDYCSKYKEYVCVDALGNIIQPQYVSMHFKVILEKNGLKKIRFHDLRHSCASMLLANKVPMKYIQVWLGHSDMSTTANIYSHLDDSDKLTSASVLGDILG